VLACNGVRTPRLLLNSASGRFPSGLANSSDLVGKNLMFHPYVQVYGYVAAETDSNRAPPTCLWSKEFYETDRSRGFVRGYTFQFGRGVGPVAEAVASEAKGLLPWGAGHHTAFRRLNGHRLGLSAICEDLPEEHNRVTLDPVLKDSHGIPAPRIDYSIAHDDDVALGMALPPLLRPEIEDVMEINVGQEWRDHRALRRADFARPYLPVFHHPTFSHLRIRRTTRRSPMRCSTKRMRCSWSTVSKKPAMSASRIQFTAVRSIATARASSASC